MTKQEKKERKQDELFSEAMSSWDKRCVKQMLHDGYDLRHPRHQKREMTPLMLAENKFFVKLLLDHGADIEMINVHRQTTLLFATDDGDYELVKSCIQSGAKVDALDGHGRSPLMNALINGDERSAKLLMKHGADIHLRDKDGNSIMHFAAGFGRTKSLLERLFKQGMEVDLVNNDGDTPLIEAAREHNEQAVELLIRHGALVNHKNHVGLTALCVACEKSGDGCLKIIELLTAHGADVNHIGNDGLMPVQRCMSGMGLQCVKHLLECGADPNPIMGMEKDGLLNKVAYEWVKLNEIKKNASKMSFGQASQVVKIARL